MFIRARIAKGREVMFISHLDYARTIERTMRRAGVPLAFTEGFNPHPKISYGPPLPLGITSRAEFFDLELKEYLNADDFIIMMNNTFPTGLFALDARTGYNKPAPLTASINREDYRIVLETAEEFSNLMEDEVPRLLGREEINVVRKSPKGEKIVNIRPFIIEVKVISRDHRIFTLDIRTATGPQGNFRPRDLLYIWPGSVLLGQHRQNLWIARGDVLHDPIGAWEVE